MLAGKDESGIFEDAVEKDDELAQAGGESDERFFAARQELLVMLPEDAVVAHGAEGSHVERAANCAASAGDVPGAFEWTAIPVPRGDAYEGDNRFVAKLPELWELGNERGGDDRTDA